MIQQLQRMRWLKRDQLPPLHWRESGKELTGEAVALLLGHMIYKEDDQYDPESKRFIDLIDQRDLGSLAVMLYQKRDQKRSDIWYLGLAGLFGTEQIGADIMLFYKNHQQKLEDESHLKSALLRVIALQGGVEGRAFIKNLHYKEYGVEDRFGHLNARLNPFFNHKKFDYQSRESALISLCGFSHNGKLQIIYGKRRFDITLQTDFRYSIIDQGGKQYQHLPKPNQDDPPQRAEGEYQRFQRIKKDIKKIITKQKKQFKLMMENRWSALLMSGLLSFWSIR